MFHIIFIINGKENYSIRHNYHEISKKRNKV